MTKGSTERMAGALARTIGSAALGAAGVASVAAGATASLAQTTPGEATAKPPTSGVPTTRILAIGSLTPAANGETLKRVMPSEVKETVQLYLAGKLDQWFVKQDGTGVVFIFNMTDAKETLKLLEDLPLGRAGLMEFEVIPLGPLSPLGMLLEK